MKVNRNQWKPMKINVNQFKSIKTVRSPKKPTINYKKFSNKGFQIDASKIALSANQIDCKRILANPRASSKHHFGKPSKRVAMVVVWNDSFLNDAISQSDFEFQIACKSESHYNS